MKLGGLFSWIVLLSVATAWGQLVPEQVAIIAMAQSPESRALASYYAKARGIPESQIYLLEGKPDRTVARATWEGQMRPAILKWLIEKGLSTKIRCLVTVWDVPLVIEKRPADSPAVAARMAYLPQIRARKVREVGAVLRWLESVGAPQAPASKPLAADVSLQQIVSEFDKTFNAAQSRRQAVSADEQKQMDAALQQILVFAGGNNAVVQMIATRAKAEKLSPEQIAQQALFGGRVQGLQVGVQALTALPGTVSRDEKLMELTEALSGRFGAIRWIDQELQLLKKNESAASFDSELSLLYWQDYPVLGWLPNPWHYSYDSNPGRRATTLMVARLAAPTPQIVQRMIDDGIAAEKTYLQGNVYIDARAAKADPAKAAASGSFDQYEQSLLDLAARLKQRTDLPVVLDTNPAVFVPGSCPKAALYCGWYSVGKYVDAFEWVPGAVGYHLGSYEATWLRGPNPSTTPGEKAWCPAMLEDGACATLGPVMEPYLSAFPLPDDFFSLLLTGKYSLVEVYYRTNPSVSWAMVLVGDPLYNPYRNHPILSEDALPERLRRGQPASTSSNAPEQADSTEAGKATREAREAKPGGLVLPGANP